MDPMPINEVLWSEKCLIKANKIVNLLLGKLLKKILPFPLYQYALHKIIKYLLVWYFILSK